MSLVQHFQANQRSAIYSPAPCEASYSQVPREDQIQTDDIHACTTIALEAYSKGLFERRYLNPQGLVKTITGSEEINPLLRSGLVLRSTGKILYLARMGLLGGAPLDELEKKLQNKAPNVKSIFISNQLEQKDLAKDIEQEFEKKGFLVIRDESNLSHGMNLPIITRILNHPNLDYVLAVISDSYLKSESCMSEINEIMKRSNFADTLLPFVMADDPNERADIYNGADKYLIHWRNKLATAKSAHEVNNEVIQNIINNFKTFANTFDTHIKVSEGELKEERYQPFFDLINAKKAQENLEIVTRLGKQEGSSSSNTYAGVASASSSSSNTDSITAMQKTVLLAQVELNPSKFIEAAKVLKTEDDKNALVNAFAFGQDKWQKYFGAIDEPVPALPKDIFNILCSDDPFMPFKKIAETHILTLVPAKVNGKPLKHENFRKLIKAPREGQKSDYINQCHIGAPWSVAPGGKARWVLMTKHIIPGSSGLSYQDLQKLVRAKRDYDVPDVLAATVGIFAHHVRTGEYLFPKERYRSYTQCQERHEGASEFGNYAAVGNFCQQGLSIIACDNAIGVGVGAQRNFF